MTLSTLLLSFALVAAVLTAVTWKIQKKHFLFLLHSFWPTARVLTFYLGKEKKD